MRIAIKNMDDLSIIPNNMNSGTLHQTLMRITTLTNVSAGAIISVLMNPSECQEAYNSFRTVYGVNLTINAWQLPQASDTIPKTNSAKPMPQTICLQKPDNKNKKNHFKLGLDILKLFFLTMKDVLFKLSTFSMPTEWTPSMQEVVGMSGNTVHTCYLQIFIKSTFTEAEDISIFEMQ